MSVALNSLVRARRCGWQRWPATWLLALLLALLLVLPLAQAAAMWHGLSHVVPQAQTQDDDAPPAAQCDLCLSAAALGAGALTSAALPLLMSRRAQALPQSPRAAHWHASIALAYRSRAPPLAPR